MTFYNQYQHGGHALRQVTTSTDWVIIDPSMTYNHMIIKKHILRSIKCMVFGSTESNGSDLSSVKTQLHNQRVGGKFFEKTLLILRNA